MEPNDLLCMVTEQGGVDEYIFDFFKKNYCFSDENKMIKNNMSLKDISKSKSGNCIKCSNNDQNQNQYQDENMNTDSNYCENNNFYNNNDKSKCRNHNGCKKENVKKEEKEKEKDGDKDIKSRWLHKTEKKNSGDSFNSQNSNSSLLSSSNSSIGSSSCANWTFLPKELKGNNTKKMPRRNLILNLNNKKNLLEIDFEDKKGLDDELCENKENNNENIDDNDSSSNNDDDNDDDKNSNNDSNDNGDNNSINNKNNSYNNNSSNNNNNNSYSDNNSNYVNNDVTCNNDNNTNSNNSNNSNNIDNNNDSNDNNTNSNNSNNSNNIDNNNDSNDNMKIKNKSIFSISQSSYFSMCKIEQNADSLVRTNMPRMIESKKSNLIIELIKRVEFEVESAQKELKNENTNITTNRNENEMEIEIEVEPETTNKKNKKRSCNDSKLKNYNDCKNILINSTKSKKTSNDKIKDKKLNFEKKNSDDDMTLEMKNDKIKTLNFLLQCNSDINTNSNSDIDINNIINNDNDMNKNKSTALKNVHDVNVITNNLPYLGKRNRKYSEVWNEEDFIYKSKQEEIFLPIVDDWSLLINNYNDDYDGVYKDWSIHQKSLLNNNRKKNYKKINDKKDTNDFDITSPPVPVSMVHPGSWGKNRKENVEKFLNILKNKNEILDGKENGNIETNDRNRVMKRSIDFSVKKSNKSQSKNNNVDSNNSNGNSNSNNNNNNSNNNNMNIDKHNDNNHNDNNDSKNKDNKSNTDNHNNIKNIYEFIHPSSVSTKIFDVRGFSMNKDKEDREDLNVDNIDEWTLQNEISYKELIALEATNYMILNSLQNNIMISSQLNGVRTRRKEIEEVLTQMYQLNENDYHAEGRVTYANIPVPCPLFVPQIASSTSLSSSIKLKKKEITKNPRKVNGKFSNKFNEIVSNPMARHQLGACLLHHVPHGEFLSRAETGVRNIYIHFIFTFFAFYCHDENLNINFLLSICFFFIPLCLPFIFSFFLLYFSLSPFLPLLFPSFIPLSLSFLFFLFILSFLSFLPSFLPSSLIHSLLPLFPSFFTFLLHLPSSTSFVCYLLFFFPFFLLFLLSSSSSFLHMYFIVSFLSL